MSARKAARPGLNCTARAAAGAGRHACHPRIHIHMLRPTWTILAGNVKGGHGPLAKRTGRRKALAQAQAKGRRNRVVERRVAGLTSYKADRTSTACDRSEPV